MIYNKTNVACYEDFCLWAVFAKNTIKYIRIGFLTL